MTALRVAAACAFSILSLSVVAQSKPDTSYFNDAGDANQRSFALVVESSPVTISGSWHGTTDLARYAQDHAGTYIVFVDKGVLRRLENPNRLAEAQHLYEPMRALETKQRALAAEQQPLAAQQRALGTQQRAATDPDEMRRIGAIQTEIGAQQGNIGRIQGTIGRQQGEIGRAFHARVESMLDACLADGTCPRVTTEAAQQ